MELLVIRHGESKADILNVMEGRADFELTRRGHEQAHAMALWVSEHNKVDRIFASPLKRAAQTAQHLSEAAGVPVQHDDDLMEWQNGLLAGLPHELADQKYPRPKVRYPHSAPYETESLIAFRSRAETILSKILNEYSDDETIAVVSHGGMISMLFRAFLMLPVTDTIFIASGDTGIHHWRTNGQERIIRSLNGQEHLPRHLR